MVEIFASEVLFSVQVYESNGKYRVHVNIDKMLFPQLTTYILFADNLGTLFRIDDKDNHIFGSFYLKGINLRKYDMETWADNTVFLFTPHDDFQLIGEGKNY